MSRDKLFIVESLREQSAINLHLCGLLSSICRRLDGTHNHRDLALEAAIATLNERIKSQHAELCRIAIDMKFSRQLVIRGEN